MITYELFKKGPSFSRINLITYQLFKKGPSPTRYYDTHGAPFNPLGGATIRSRSADPQRPQPVYFDQRARRVDSDPGSTGRSTTDFPIGHDYSLSPRRDRGDSIPAKTYATNHKPNQGGKTKTVITALSQHQMQGFFRKTLTQSCHFSLI